MIFVRVLICLAMLVSLSGCYLHKNYYVLIRPKKVTIENQLSEQIVFSAHTQKTSLYVDIKPQTIVSVPIHSSKFKDTFVQSIIYDEAGRIVVFQDGKIIHELNHADIPGTRIGFGYGDFKEGTINIIVSEKGIIFDMWSKDIIKLSEDDVRVESNL